VIFYQVYFCIDHCSNNPKIVQTMLEQYVDRLIGRLIIRTTPLDGTKNVPGMPPLI
jgi:hypothetical protein